MNERIKQLANEAGIAVWGDAVYMYHPGNTLDSTVMTKFAELIVRECANMAESFHRHQYDFTGNLELHEFIREHFGVEE